MSLVPTELWENKFGDNIRGLSAVFKPRNPNSMVYIKGLGSCFATRSARAALSIAIKAIDLRPDARIGVPLYCCPAVFKAIKAADCTPHFIDIDPETFCISPEDLAAKSSRLDAAIVAHMFGNVCDIAGLEEAMNGKPIIEDCAQSLGSKINGRMTGSFGVMAAFSFRSGKYLSVGEGGALISSKARFNSRISQLISSMPIPSHFGELVHIAKTFMRSKLRSRPLFGLVGYVLWGLYNRRTSFISKSPIILSQIFKSDLAVIFNRMAFLNSMIEAQRANSEYYIRNLRVGPNMMCLEKPGTFYNRFMFPIVFQSSRDRDEMAAYLKIQQIGSSKPYEEVIEGAANHYGYGGDCPISERLLRRTLIIPCHHKLRKTDIEHIVQCVNAAWEKITKKRR